jgi:hypothetical protein
MRIEMKDATFAIREIVEMHRKHKPRIKRSILKNIYDNEMVREIGGIYDLKYILENNKELVRNRKEALMKENLIHSKADNLWRMDVDGLRKRWKRIFNKLGGIQ